MIAKGNVTVTATIIENKIEKEMEKRVDKALYEVISEQYGAINLDKYNINFNLAITITNN